MDFLETTIFLTLYILGASCGTITSLGQSSQLFATDIYKELSTNSGNILISPSSLQTILALTQMGANGNTFNEMSKALSLPTSKSRIQQVFKHLLPEIRSIKFATFDVANKIYVKNDFDISPEFSEIARESFDAEIETKDFDKRKETADQINEWVESKTNNKIKKLVKEEMISRDAQMILINALYFNGKWETPFDERFTKEKRFYTNQTHWEKVRMMHGNLFCKHASNNQLQAQFLELPYAGKEFTMTFILPYYWENLSELEKNIHQVLQPQNYQESDIDVTIPLFKIEQTIAYNSILQKLGMVEAFTNKADLTGLSASKRRSLISMVLQKTFIEVNEKGTEAAAATEVFIDRIIGGRTGFEANHPFLFVLRQSSTGIVHFIGRYTGPN